MACLFLFRKNKRFQAHEAKTKCYVPGSVFPRSSAPPCERGRKRSMGQRCLLTTSSSPSRDTWLSPKPWHMSRRAGAQRPPHSSRPSCSERQPDCVHARVCVHVCACVYVGGVVKFPPGTCIIPRGHRPPSPCPARRTRQCEENKAAGPGPRHVHAGFFHVCFAPMKSRAGAKMGRLGRVTSGASQLTSGRRCDRSMGTGRRGV